MTFSSKLYSGFVTDRIRNWLSAPQTILEKLQKSVAKKDLSALWFLLYSKEYPLVSHYLADALKFIQCSGLFISCFEWWRTISKCEESYSWTLCSRGIKRLCWDILSLNLMLISSNILQRISHFFFFFWACNLQDFSSLIRDEPGPSAVKVLSANHWTSREFLILQRELGLIVAFVFPNYE